MPELADHHLFNFSAGEQDMISVQWIFLILEDGLFPHESICHAIKLAKRINCSISVLMLADYTDEGFEGKTDEQDMMQHTLDMITAEGIHAQGAFGYGDKASEFLKHLALKPSLSAIVWGGNEGIGKGQIKKKGDYWFTKIKSTIPCPVVRPTIKDKSKKQFKHRSLKI